MRLDPKIPNALVPYLEWVRVDCLVGRKTSGGTWEVSPVDAPTIKVDIKTIQATLDFLALQKPLERPEQFSAVFGGYILQRWMGAWIIEKLKPYTPILETHSLDEAYAWLSRHLTEKAS